MLSVVTGANGLVGCNLVRALLDRGDRVRGLIHENSTSLDGLDVETAKGDVREPASLRAAFAGADRIYHCAGAISITGSQGGWVEEINIGGTRNVVDACIETGVQRLVHVSSVHALSPLPADVPIDENRALVEDPHHPAYSLSKAAGERVVLEGVERGLDAVIVNPSGILGPNDFAPSRIGELLIWLYNRTLPALVDGGYDWVDVRDVAAGACAAAEQGRTGERYLLTGHWVSVPDVAQLVSDITGEPPTRWSTPLWVARLTAPFAEMYAKMAGTPALYTRESIQVLSDNGDFCRDKAARVLGHHPRPLRDSIADTLRWFTETGRLGANPS